MAAYKPGDAYIKLFTTASPSTGGASNADALPTASLNRNGSDDSGVTLVVTNLDTGRYKISGVIPSSYAAGDVLNVTVTATVANVTGKAVIDTVVLDSKRLADKPAVSVAAGDVTGNLPASVTSYATNQDPATLVLGATASSWNSSGTVGAKINLTTAGVDPWTVAIPGSYTTGQAGAILNAINSKTATISDPWAVTLPGSYTSSQAGSILNALNTQAAKLSFVTASGVNYLYANMAYASGQPFSLADGTAQAVSASSITLASDSSDPRLGSDLPGWFVEIISATANAGQLVRINTYNASTKVATVTWATTAPTGTVTYNLHLPLALQTRQEIDSNSTALASLTTKVNTLPTAVQVRQEIDTNSASLATLTGKVNLLPSAVQVRQEIDARSAVLATLTTKVNALPTVAQVAGALLANPGTPLANDNAGAVAANLGVNAVDNVLIDGTITMKQALAWTVAALVGTTSGATLTGAGTVAFATPAIVGSRTRITTTFDAAHNRTNVVLSNPV
jgi:hypothetical protein